MHHDTIFNHRIDILPYRRSLLCACAVYASALNLAIEEQSAKQLQIYNLNGWYFISHTFNSTWQYLFTL